jgi:ribosomal protein S18 acetylase RimI-like enzyme
MGLTSDASFSIRKAQFDDLRVMARLIGELFAIESDFKSDFDKQYTGLKLLFRENNTDILVAKYRNTAIGMVTVQRVISSAEGGYAGLIEDVIVREEYRGMGVGSRLIERVVSLARERGYLRLQLAADKANHRALEFYTRHGFHKTHMNLYHLAGFGE